jgi:hypothetical protein
VKSIEVSEEHTASIFRVEEQAKQESNMKPAACRTLVEYWCLPLKSSNGGIFQIHRKE